KRVSPEPLAPKMFPRLRALARPVQSAWIPFRQMATDDSRVNCNDDVADSVGMHAIMHKVEHLLERDDIYVFEYPKRVHHKRLSNIDPWRRGSGVSDNQPRRVEFAYETQRA